MSQFFTLCFKTETSAEISCTGGVRVSVDIMYSHDGFLIGTAVCETCFMGNVECSLEVLLAKSV